MMRAGAVLRGAGLDPLGLLSRLSPDLLGLAAAAARDALPLLHAGRELAPPRGPQMFRRMWLAAADTDVPAALLAALSWELAHYDPEHHRDGRTGLMGLPWHHDAARPVALAALQAGEQDAWAAVADQVAAAAELLRPGRGRAATLAGRLVQYVGAEGVDEDAARSLALRVVGAAAALAAAELPEL